MPTPNPIPLPTLEAFTKRTLHLTQATLTRHPKIEGDDHMIFTISESPGHLLRVTKPREDRPLSLGTEMQRFDIAVRRLIAAEYAVRGLSGDIIPKSVGHEVLTGDGVHAVSMETKLEGVGLHRGGLTGLTERTVEGLVEMMRVMKGVDLEGLGGRLKDLGVVGFEVPFIPWPEIRGMRERAVVAWRRLVSRGQILGDDYGVKDGDDFEALGERKTAFIGRVMDMDDETSRRVLIHNDIKGEHILVGSDGRITGILDWADAGVGYPATDIAGLVLTVGPRLAIRIAREVGYAEDEILQGLIQARCECVLRLDDRLNGDDELTPIDLLKGQLVLSMEDCELVDCV
ncbi:hypothetical protein BDV32DRAFT_161206 [Aspergillus pseudonomiae]|uniref:Aminoglycoside phosphotransferase domain-containing protein n=1 Tax=Aspergillus pseudonomiae TaxID=1506151 RepID=A0A5N7DGU2_9EURO|nr:uncharacterized protein BDV37DRAFT_293003 [Aspergillus pseudonomiae]KAB8256307.1 hypothetical protein BDV32DRAFT_161206 [Aspergillus pseudonomiae]KAE8405514.1 hypothetical protein BDV37DRAFT_293003 [Aspergillus pseudonomiae]